MKNPLLLLLGLIFGLFIVGLAAQQGGVLLLALPLLAYLAAAIAMRPAGVKLAVQRQVTPERAAQNTPVLMRLAVTNEGSAVAELVVQDTLPAGLRLLEGDLSRIAFLPPGGRIELEYTLEARRGEYNTQEVTLIAGDGFGCFEHIQVSATSPHLVVRPQYRRVSRIKIRPPQTRGFAGPIAARQGGSGIDFFVVREYQPGDPQRQINWKISARRHDELFTNVFEQERVADVGIILDARQRMDILLPPQQALPSEDDRACSLFEYSVQAAASLAETFLNDGNRVSLLVYGSGLESVFPGYGKMQRDRILRTLSRARTAKNFALENLAYLPTRFFPAKSQIVFISPLLAEDIRVLAQMRSKGYSLMVISPDPVAFVATHYADLTSPAYRLASAERTLMLQLMRRSGAQVVNWCVDQSLEDTLQTTLARQPLQLQFIQGGYGQ